MTPILTLTLTFDYLTSHKNLAISRDAGLYECVHRTRANTFNHMKMAPLTSNIGCERVKKSMSWLQRQLGMAPSNKQRGKHNS